ncbi:MAG TPA: YciI family protein [Verrucomicrobiae bacterium]|nr:YciI family protein [Verrucomicrobiae bacterium]
MTPNDKSKPVVMPLMTHFFFMDQKDPTKVRHWFGAVGPSSSDALIQTQQQISNTSRNVTRAGWGVVVFVAALVRGCRFCGGLFDYTLEVQTTSNDSGRNYMRFMMMVKGSETAVAPPKELMEALAKLTGRQAQEGKILAGGGLAPMATSSRVRVSGGKLAVLDGPFTETKEVVGGYAVMEFESREAAVKSVVEFMELHKKYWPGWEGETEVRQILDEELSPKEAEVLSFIAAGNSDKSIADRLAISEDALNDQVKSLLSKLGVNDRTHAVTLALQRGILQS